MRRLVSLPSGVLLSLLVASTAFASFCGNESKQGGAGQFATLWIDFAHQTAVITDGGAEVNRVRGGFIDVNLDFDGDGTSDCFIDDTFVLSEHTLGHVAPGQLFEMLAVNPAVHRGQHPDGNPGQDDTGVGFAALSGGC